MAVQPDVQAALAAGVAAQQAQDHAGAVQHFAQALAVDPSLVAARHHQALSLRALGQFAAAEAQWREVMALAPTFSWAPAALGNLLRARAQAAAAPERARLLDEALVLHRHALALEPLEPGHAHNLLASLAAVEAWSEAVRTFTVAADAHASLPHFPELAARACIRLGQFTQALELAEKTLRLQPHNIEAHVSLASALRELGEADAATNTLERAATLAPADATVAFNLAQLRCYRGDWSMGLAGLAADRTHLVATGQLKGPPGSSLWQGQPAPEAHLLLLAEQGLGDTIQLVRYAALASQRVGRVTLVPPWGLSGGHWMKELLSRTPGLHEVLRPGEALPHASLFAPMFALPHLCAPAAAAVFAPTAYVAADPGRVEAWGKALGPRRGELRVALAWQGNPQYRGDARRSMPLSSLRPALLALPHPKVRWLSVQKGVGAQQLHTPAGEDIEDWGARLDLGPDTYADTAAFLQHVDVVLSTDTSLPHLAAAMGLPTWMMLAAVPDWRWQAEGQSSPWYPSMRLFRQKRPGDWNGCVTEVQKALADLTAA